MKKLILLIISTILPLALYSQQKGFKLNEQEYFENGGVNVMTFAAQPMAAGKQLTVAPEERDKHFMKHTQPGAAGRLPVFRQEIL